MARVTPIRREDAPDLEDVFARAEQALGFVPNSFFAMGRSPGILRAFTRLAREVIGVPGKAPLPLKRMAGYMASRSAGCQYCSAHTAETASAVDGVSAEKVAAIWEYETSDLFDDAERAVLRMAQGAGLRRTRYRTRTWKNCTNISTTTRSSNWSPPCACSAG